ncbi:hypothetical protein EI94DRAFT_1704754 [Lactarius quietus]|nr:hypothetical protein EI94DRAFT_1704754 [Lactarius quietus]
MYFVTSLGILANGEHFDMRRRRTTAAESPYGKMKNHCGQRPLDLRRRRSLAVRDSLLAIDRGVTERRAENKRRKGEGLFLSVYVFIHLIVFRDQCKVGAKEGGYKRRLRTCGPMTLKRKSRNSDTSGVPSFRFSGLKLSVHSCKSVPSNEQEVSSRVLETVDQIQNSKMDNYVLAVGVYESRSYDPPWHVMRRSTIDSFDTFLRAANIRCAIAENPYWEK